MSRASSSEGWEQLRLPRRLNAMLQTESGLAECTITWLDNLHVHVHTAVRLPVNRGMLARLDLGAVGSSIDLQITVMEMTSARSSGIGRGWLHRARWITTDLAEGDRLAALLPRLNPALALESIASSVSRSRSSTMSVAHSDAQHSRSRSQSHSASNSSVASTTGKRRVPTIQERRHSNTERTPSGKSKRERRGSVRATLALGSPINVLVEATDGDALSRALRLGPGSLKLAVKFDQEQEATTAVLLVFKLADGSFMQFPANVVRVAGRRWLLESIAVSETDLAVFRKTVAEPPRG